MQKKREILPTLEAAITALSRLGEDAAKLEYLDNEQASLRLKRDFKNVMHAEISTLKKIIQDTREQVIAKPRRHKRPPKDKLHNHQ